MMTCIHGVYDWNIFKKPSVCNHELHSQCCAGQGDWFGGRWSIANFEEGDHAVWMPAAKWVCIQNNGATKGYIVPPIQPRWKLAELHRCVGQRNEDGCHWCSALLIARRWGGFWNVNRIGPKAETIASQPGTGWRLKWLFGKCEPSGALSHSGYFPHCCILQSCGWGMQVTWWHCCGFECRWRSEEACGWRLANGGHQWNGWKENAFLASMAMNSINMGFKQMNEIEAASLMAELMKHGSTLKDALAQVERSDPLCKTQLPAIAYYVSRYGGGDQQGLICFLKEWSALAFTE